MKRKPWKWLLIPAALLLLFGGAVLVSALDDTPTVIFDAATKQFSYQNVKNEDGTPDLFGLRDIMPGDTAEWSIRVRVLHATDCAVKLYVTAEDPNVDYDLLLNQDAAGHGTLSATFALESSRGLIPTMRRLVQGSRTATFVNSESQTYLGMFTGGSSEKTIAMSFALPLEAGNEYANLTAEVSWVFLAEVIPLVSPSPTPVPTSAPTSAPEETAAPQETADPGEWVLPDEETPTPEPSATPEPYVLSEENEPEPYTPPGETMPLMYNKADHYAYIIGRGENKVEPLSNMTRAEVATIIFRSMTEECRDYYWSSSNTFTDVPTNAWYNNAVSTLSRAGVAKGYEDGSFRPDEPITRAEFTVMATRFYEMEGNTESAYTDIRNHWAEIWINSSTEYGFIEGYPDSTFRPNEPITRAEAITIFNRILRRVPADHAISGIIRFGDNTDSTQWYYADIIEATNSHDYTWNEDGSAEIWSGILPTRDWAALETVWAQQHKSESAPVYRSDTNTKDGEVGS